MNNNRTKYFLQGLSYLYQGVCDILTFGATARRTISAQEQNFAGGIGGNLNHAGILHNAQQKYDRFSKEASARLKQASILQTHNKILHDMQMTQDDFRRLFGLEHKTLMSANIDEKTVFTIGRHSALINWHTNTVHIRQRD